MKKLPIFLSTISLASGGVVAHTEQTLAFTGAGVNATSRAESRSLQTNAYVKAFDVATIYPNTGRLGFLSSVDGGISSAIKQVVIATFNYENGVREAEADAGIEALSLGVRPSWAGFVLTKRYNSPEETQGNSFKYIDLGVDLSKMNYPDTLYYAVELGGWAEADGSISETEWIYGKIDYRNCAHAAGFNNRSYCNRVLSGGTIRYHADHTGSQVIPTPSWSEEWSEILQERIEEQERLLDFYEQYPEYKTEELIEEIKQKLDNIKNILGDAKNPDGILSNIEQLQERAEELKPAPTPTPTPPPVTPKPDLNGKDPSEDGKPSIGGGVNGNKPNTGMGGADNSTQDDGVSGGLDGVFGVIQEPSDIISSTLNNTTVKNPVKNPVAIAKTEETKKDEIEDETEEDEEETGGGEQDLRKDGEPLGDNDHVPQLGGEQGGNDLLWPWVILMVSVTGVAGFWLVKSLRAKRGK